MNILRYFFCKIFNIVRSKTYLVYPDKSIKEVKLNYIPNIISIKDENKNYLVTNVLTEIVNETLVYNWIKLEEKLR